LQDILGNRIVGHGLWPQPSSDLKPPEFFLLGFLNGRVYRDNPRSLEGLKHDTEELLMALINKLLWGGGWGKRREKENACLQEGWGHFQHQL
jgi:hypothetical protein